MSPSPEITVAIRGQGYTLRPLGLEDAVEWLDMSVQAGRLIAKIKAAYEPNREHWRELMLTGRIMAGMALGDYDLACSLTEDERREIIEAQDGINLNTAMTQMLNVPGIAAQAYVGADGR